MNFFVFLRATIATMILLSSVRPTQAIVSNFVGAVYAMSNKLDGNTIVAYGRIGNGTLELIGEYPTFGKGGTFDGGEGLDPLISANAIALTDNRRFLFAVNAGSNSVTVFKINRDFSLRAISKSFVPGVGPNSIAYFDGTVYVTSIDADGVFNGEPDQEGLVTGYFFHPKGYLLKMRGSSRKLTNRPSDVHFSPDGRFLLVSSINAGSAALPDEQNDEIVAYSVTRFGRLSDKPVSSAASTAVGNAENRNLPSAIGFDIVEDAGRHYVVVTEAREFQANGMPPALPALQTGSVSTWELGRNGTLTPVALDVQAGNSQSDGQRTACWLDFSIDKSTFWVSNAIESTLSSYSFNEGQISLLDDVAFSGTGPSNDNPFGTTDGFIDLKRSDDGEYVYQLYGLTGTIGVLSVEDDGFGSALTLIQEVTGTLPFSNTQGIVAI